MNQLKHIGSIYGAPDIVTATFVQQPIWLAIFFAFFQGENGSPHIVFAQCSYQISSHPYLEAWATC